MELIKQYESYKEERDKANTQIAIYESKIEESVAKLKDIVEGLDFEMIKDITGIDYSLDLELIRDKEYLTESIGSNKLVRDKLVEIGIALINSRND